MTISLKLLAQISGIASKSSDAGTATIAINEKSEVALANGTGANEGNLHYIDAFSLASGANTTYDLAGALTDDLGQSAVFTAVKALMIIADSTNTTDLTIGNATNPFAGPLSSGATTITLKPGAVAMFTNPSAAGWAITGGANDEIKIVNGSGATATGRICVVGES